MTFFSQSSPKFRQQFVPHTVIVLQSTRVVRMDAPGQQILSSEDVQIIPIDTAWLLQQDVTWPTVLENLLLVKVVKYGIPSQERVLVRGI